MNLVQDRVQLDAVAHQFPAFAFGSIKELKQQPTSQNPDTLLIACSEMGSAPDNASFGSPDRLIVLQHLAATMPSKADCELYPELSCRDLEDLFVKYEFRHIIICGHLACGVIPYWLRPQPDNDQDIGFFRRRFKADTCRLVDNTYSPASEAERVQLMIFEHVLCQIQNLLTHPFIRERVDEKRTLFHGWVVEDSTARVFTYDQTQSAFLKS